MKLATARIKSGPRKIILEKTCSPKIYSTIAIFSGNDYVQTAITIKNLVLH